MSTKRFIILANEDPFDHQLWVRACEAFAGQVQYEVVDLTKSDWLERITSLEADVLLARPSKSTSTFRQLYQERIDVLANDLEYEVFPSYDEIRIYENKRFFAYWAKATGIPHPKTHVFYHKTEAKEQLSRLGLPLVGKLNIGASGNGVVVLKDRKVVDDYIEKAFSEGLRARTGPKLSKGKLLQRLWDKLRNPAALANRLRTYRAIAADRQKGFVIVQEFVPHQFEWRVVRIGDSFFAHKKLKRGEMASGSLLKDYENPPLEIFDFVKELTDRFGFRSVTVDLFEDERDNYLVNEIQCIFGQSDPYQMLVDGKPGRYRCLNGKWSFEPGDFNANESFNLRVAHLLESENSAQPIN